MDNVEKLLKGTVGELDKLLNARNVLGDPIDRDGATVIPIVSYGFGFGAGGGTSAKNESGGGAGAGGGIKPLGAIIFDDNGARVEAVKGATTSLIETVAETAVRVMNRSTRGKSSDEKGDKKADE